MTVAGVFSGVGMMEYAASLLGCELLWMCENDPFCQRVLNKRFPGIPVYPDVRGIDEQVERPTGLVGGFPCQGISLAGQGLGLKDQRSGLWHEFLRVIALLRPQFVLIENVRNLLSRGMSTVLIGLRSIGYDVEWDVIPAAAVGAAHLRERVWIVARAKEYAANPVYGDELRKKDEAVSFAFDGKLPRAGRMNSNLRALEPIAPRKTKRRDGWSYWVGENLWVEMQRYLWPTPDANEARGPHGVHVLNGRHLTGTRAQRTLTAVVTTVERGQLREPVGFFRSFSPSRRAAWAIEDGTALLPTPDASVFNDGERTDTWLARREKLKNEWTSPKHPNGRVNGSLNPDWVEWLMSCPLGWTDLSLPNALLTQTPWWHEPFGVPRVATGIKNRPGRLRALGNAVVWPCAYIALERGLRSLDLIP